MNRQTLLESIATTISDYRSGEISAINESHVKQWINQFHPAYQEHILTEMDYLLKKYYLSRKQAITLIRQFIKSLIQEAIIIKKLGSEPADVMKRISFLKIQRKGSSQNEILSLVDQVLQGEFSLSLNDCGKEPIIYIYLDDCLFSGQTAFYDLKDRWLAKASDGELWLVFFAIHQSGYSYNIDRRLKQEIIRSRKNIEVKLKLLNNKWRFENNRRNPDKFDCFWCTEFTEEDEYYGYDEYAYQYLQYLFEQIEEKEIEKEIDIPIFRPQNVPKIETVFSSKISREIIEKEFFKRGAYINSLPQDPNEKMRPLGYEYLESLGFGAIFITYRNIANNCPLVLWWGDPKSPASHPFSKWYPLFPRKGN